MALAAPLFGGCRQSGLLPERGRLAGQHCRPGSLQPGGNTRVIDQAAGQDDGELPSAYPTPQVMRLRPERENLPSRNHACLPTQEGRQCTLVHPVSVASRPRP